MTMFRVGPAGIPASLKTDMDAVLNKKFGTSTTYAPNTWPENVNLLGPLPEKTASGSVAHVTDGADSVPLKAWEVTVPANLSGVSSLQCAKSGKNLLPNKTYQRNANTLRLGTDTLDGRLSLKAGTYTLSITSDVAIGSMVYTIDGTSTNITFTSSGTRYYGSFTLSADTDDFFVHVYKSGGITAANVSDFMLEVGSTASAYAPYEAPTVSTVSLGRTIYGGSADVVNGTGSDNYSTPFIFDGSLDEEWKKHGSIASWFYIDLPFTNAYANNSETGFITSSWGTQKAYANVSSLANGEYAYGAIERFVIKNTDFTEVADFKQWLSENPVTLVYKKATADAFTFTPISPTPETPLGVSNYWADADSTSDVTYRADIQLALNA